MKYASLFSIFLFSQLILKAQVNPNPCSSASSVHIVILGSSTAAGSGPSTSSNAWVNRYRATLQSINPSNQVTNLAVGGTTTYHIMPDWFTAPAGRPAANSNKNVSQAITLNADAIIVNMPSNDASNGFNTIEQMHNFITIAQVADSAGIPVWICTTQPRNGFNAAKKLVQTEVRDSILAYFGNYAIDFWNPFADSIHNLKSAFNSGDGVHMNDTAHSVMEQKVLAEGILDSLYTPLNYVDHRIVDQYWLNQSLCGDSNATLNVVVANVGTVTSNTISVTSSFFNQVNSSSFIQTNTLSTPLNPCTTDTVSFKVNTFNKAKLDYQVYLTTSDSIKSNDTSSIEYLQSIGHPEIFALLDSFCLGDTLQFEVGQNSANDHVLWFNSMQDDSIIFIGNPLFGDDSLTATSYFARSVRGSLTNTKSLKASETSTTNWNGMMFDVKANDSLNLDSISLKINSAGAQTIVAYYKIGSYKGHETAVASWTSWSTISVNVANAGEFIILDLPDLLLNPTDTLGIYIHMNNSGSTLSYRSGSATTYSNSELSVLPGSGIGYTFGQIYTPRHFCGELFYHYGFNAGGYCSTEKTEVKPYISDPAFSLGNDTTISKNSSLILSSKKQFQSFLWSNGSMNATLVVDSSSFKLDSNLIWLQALNEYSCSHTDTIIVYFDPSSAIGSFEVSGIRQYPNPVESMVYFDFGKNTGEFSVSIYSIEGKEVLKKTVQNCQIFPISTNFKQGIYFVKITNEGNLIYRSKFIKS